MSGDGGCPWSSASMASRSCVRWVMAGATAEQREQRGEFAKKCLAVALAGADHDQMNRQIRSALRPAVRDKDVSNIMEKLTMAHQTSHRTRAAQVKAELAARVAAIDADPKLKDEHRRE